MKKLNLILGLVLFLAISNITPAQSAKPSASPAPACNTNLIWPAYSLPAPSQLVTFTGQAESAFKGLSGASKAASLKQVKQIAETSYCNDRTKWKSCAGLALRLSQTKFTNPDDAETAHSIYKKAEEVMRDYFEHAFDKKITQSITSLGPNLEPYRVVLLGRQLSRLREDDPNKKFQRLWALRAAEIHGLGRNFFGSQLDVRPRFDLAAEVYESLGEKKLAQQMWTEAAEYSDNLYKYGTSKCPAGSPQIIPFRTKFFTRSGSPVPPLPNLAVTKQK